MYATLPHCITNWWSVQSNGSDITHCSSEHQWTPQQNIEQHLVWHSIRHTQFCVSLNLYYCFDYSFLSLFLSSIYSFSFCSFVSISLSACKHSDSNLQGATINDIVTISKIGKIIATTAWSIRFEKGYQVVIVSTPR